MGGGYGEKGALGTGEFKSRARPARVQIEGRVKQISAGAMHSAFLTNSGELFMCGANDNGELGLPRKGGICVPTAVPTKAKFMDVSCGIFYTLMLD
jgi:alpha-tubulin suppressor-like RCC1 family protein